MVCLPGSSPGDHTRPPFRQRRCGRPTVCWKCLAYSGPLTAETLFFARALGGGVNLEKAEGSTTRFGWLPEMWQRYPDHQVIVLTDGAGSLPAYIPDSCRARTSALLVGLENYSDEQRELILAVAEAIAGKVVEVRSLDDLAGVWATLIPRRQVA